MFLLPTLEELEQGFKSINPTYRTLEAAWNHINSDRGTMGQEIAFSQDFDIFEDGLMCGRDWEEDY